jgi:hypothetical protein
MYSTDFPQNSLNKEIRTLLESHVDGAVDWLYQSGIK